MSRPGSLDKGSRLICAVVLAAGQGTRLRPLTDTLPKPLLPLADTTLLGHNLQHLARAGIERVLTVIPPGTMPLFEAYAVQHPDLELDFIEQREALGTGHAVLLAREWVAERRFFLCYGDNVTTYDFDQLIRSCEAHDDDGILAVRPVEDPTKHGVVELGGRLLQRIVEKPKHPVTNLSFAGMCVLPPAVFEALDECPANPDGEYYLPDALQRLADAGYRLGTDVLDAWRLNVNHPGQLMEAHEYLMERLENPCPPPIPGVSVHPPVVVAPTARIAPGAELGPMTRIGDGCIVERDCVLNRCVLLSGAHLGQRCALSHVIVGAGAKVAPHSRYQGAEEPSIWV